MFKQALCTSVVFALLGCASVTLHNEARSVNIGQNDSPSSSKIDLTWEVNNDLSSEYFGYFNFNIRNTSDKWITLTGMRIVFPESSQNKNVRIVLGRELEQWYTAQQKVVAVSDFNKTSASLLLSGVGAGLATFSDIKAFQTTGSAMAAGSLGYLAVDAFDKARDALRLAAMIPKNHLFSDSVLVPPGLFTDRWLLLNSSNHDQMGIVDSLTIEYRMEDGTIHSNRVVLRSKSHSILNRKWQASFLASHQSLNPDPKRAYP